MVVIAIGLLRTQPVSSGLHMAKYRTVFKYSRLLAHSAGIVLHIGTARAQFRPAK